MRQVQLRLDPESLVCRNRLRAYLGPQKVRQHPVEGRDRVLQRHHGRKQKLNKKEALLRIAWVWL